MAVPQKVTHIHPLRHRKGDGDVETHVYGNTVVNIHFDHVQDAERVLDDLHQAAWEIIDEIIEKGEAV